MKVLITGAQFNNKGAQSLLFTLIDQLRKKDKSIEIYYLPIDDFRKYDKKEYRFHIVYGDMEAHYYENKPLLRPFLLFKALLRKVIKKNAVKLSDVTALHRLLPEIEAIIDVSGYQLTSQFSNEMNQKFLYYIEEAKRYGKKIVLMPQSFGPFDYTEDKDKMLIAIEQDLCKVDLVFAREQEGYVLLKSQFGVSNLKLSPDLVLQGGTINWRNIYVNIPELHYPRLNGSGNIAIIPNLETFKHGNVEQILHIYDVIIEKLIFNGKNVYVFRHSNDLKACKMIYKRFADSENVHLVENTFSCEEYSKFVSQFDFIVASRYHAIVHAYKEGVPAVILGWAIKYQSLAKLFEQEEYVFDITDITIDSDEVIERVDRMCRYCNNEGKRIYQIGSQLLDHTCFDDCWEVISDQ